MLIGNSLIPSISELYKQAKTIDMIAKDKNQTPAPKVSSGNDTSKSKNDEGNLKAALSEAKKGAEKKTSATKTPSKIQEGNLNEKKREY